MSKKYLKVALVLGLFIGLGVGGYYFYSFKKSSKPTIANPLGNSLENKIKKPEVSGDILYKDESGFSFYYPKDLTVKDITPDDNVYYSKVTLTKEGKALTISVLDTKETVVENYVKKSELLKTATLYGATKLGEVAAKQFQTTDLLSTIAIDQGILYQLEGPKDGDYWEKVQGVVADSFTVGEAKTNTTSGGDNVIYEEEEVVE